MEESNCHNDSLKVNKIPLNEDKISFPTKNIRKHSEVSSRKRYRSRSRERYRRRSRSRSRNSRFCRRSRSRPRDSYSRHYRRSRSRSRNRFQKRSRSKSISKGKAFPSHHNVKRSNNIRIPKNWMDVPKMGKLIEGTNFLPLRVPLDDSYFQVSQAQLWTPRDFIHLQKKKNYNVKLIIDLTNTNRYYNGKKEFEPNGIQYIKLPIDGHDRCPNKNEIQRFFQVIEEFNESYNQNKETKIFNSIEEEPKKKVKSNESSTQSQIEEEKLVSKEKEEKNIPINSSDFGIHSKANMLGHIAIHCTHGLNRTGYLIAEYLIQKKKMTVSEALDCFFKGRSPGLLKASYIDALYHQYEPNSRIIYPEYPLWAQKKYGVKLKEKQRIYSKE